VTIHAFSDHMDVIRSGPIHVRAHITELDGGRHNSFYKGYHPNHNLDGEGNTIFYIGDVEPVGQKWVKPGETAEISVSFLKGQRFA